MKSLSIIPIIIINYIFQVFDDRMNKILLFLSGNKSAKTFTVHTAIKSIDL